MDQPRRRDLLATAAFGMASVGGVLALWPLVAALNPAADTIAKRVTFNLNDLDGTKPATIGVNTLPVMIYRRTPDEIESLKTWNGERLRDPDSAHSKQPDWAKNWRRSLKAEIMVCIATCTHPSQPCVVRKLPEYRLLICPCCGSQFDLAGRVFKGPAPTNLRVPPYRFVDETTIELVEADATT